MMETKVKTTIRKYKLISPKDKIMVGVSGGKDSTVVAYLLKKFGYNVEGIHINLGMGKYSQDCLNSVEKLCSDLGIKLHVYDIKDKMGSSMCFIRSNVQSKKSLKNCAICGVIKKWILNREARRLKADKIATGHHLDDESETFLLNILKGSPELGANIGPVTRNIRDKKFVLRIKPLYFVSEDEIRKYSKKMKLPVVYDKCPCAVDSYRIQIRGFLKSFSEKDKQNILKNSDAVMKKVKKEKEIRYCKICKEPSRQEVCRFCGLVK